MQQITENLAISSVISAYRALTEAGSRSSRSLMKFASRTYYEPEPYLIITVQTATKGKESQKYSVTYRRHRRLQNAREYCCRKLANRKNNKGHLWNI
ncbi:hypothetical protein ACS0PU_003543 [Formica fusca]